MLVQKQLLLLLLITLSSSTLCPKKDRETQRFLSQLTECSPLSKDFLTPLLLRLNRNEALTEIPTKNTTELSVLNALITLWPTETAPKTLGIGRKPGSVKLVTFVKLAYLAGFAQARKEVKENNIAAQQHAKIAAKNYLFLVKHQQMQNGERILSFFSGFIDGYAYNKTVKEKGVKLKLFEAGENIQTIFFQDISERHHFNDALSEARASINATPRERDLLDRSKDIDLSYLALYSGIKRHTDQKALETTEVLPTTLLDARILTAQKVLFPEIPATEFYSHAAEGAPAEGTSRRSVPEKPLAEPTMCGAGAGAPARDAHRDYLISDEVPQLLKERLLELSTKSAYNKDQSPFLRGFKCGKKLHNSKLELAIQCYNDSINLWNAKQKNSEEALNFAHIISFCDGVIEGIKKHPCIIEIIKSLTPQERRISPINFFSKILYEIKTFFEISPETDLVTFLSEYEKHYFIPWLKEQLNTESKRISFELLLQIRSFLIIKDRIILGEITETKHLRSETELFLENLFADPEAVAAELLAEEEEQAAQKTATQKPNRRTQKKQEDFQQGEEKTTLEDEEKKAKDAEKERLFFKKLADAREAAAAEQIVREAEEAEKAALETAAQQVIRDAEKAAKKAVKNDKDLKEKGFPAISAGAPRSFQQPKDAEILDIYASIAQRVPAAAPRSIPPAATQHAVPTTTCYPQSPDPQSLPQPMLTPSLGASRTVQMLSDSAQRQRAGAAQRARAATNQTTPGSQPPHPTGRPPLAQQSRRNGRGRCRGRGNHTQQTRTARRGRTIINNSYPIHISAPPRVIHVPVPIPLAPSAYMVYAAQQPLRNQNFLMHNQMRTRINPIWPEERRLGENDVDARANGNQDGKAWLSYLRQYKDDAYTTIMDTTAKNIEKLQTMAPGYMRPTPLAIAYWEGFRTGCYNLHTEKEAASTSDGDAERETAASAASGSTAPTIPAREESKPEQKVETETPPQANNTWQPSRDDLASMHREFKRRWEVVQQEPKTVIIDG